MRRAVLTLGVVASLAAPATAQWLGEPVWNRLEAGGFVINADYAKPNSNYGKGSTWGVRVSWGLGTSTLTAGATSWKPEGAGSLTSIGGNAAFWLIGGTLLPIASPGIRANLQLGVAHTEAANVLVSPASSTAVTGAVGFGIRLPAPGFTVEPYLSPGIRYRSVSGGGSSAEFGYAIGANADFGLLGVHLAFDNEKVKGGGNVGVFGVGAHVAP
jgi:hypothetical protein